MRPEEKADLIRELGNISRSVIAIEVRAEEREKAARQRFKALEAQQQKIDGEVEATGEHRIEALQKAHDEAKREASKWRWWVMSIGATLFTSALVGLVVFYLTNR
jgi:uncharacterized membrane protein YcjF (UPF0283 family)